jgi:hypothetical protein
LTLAQRRQRDHDVQSEAILMGTIAIHTAIFSAPPIVTALPRYTGCHRIMSNHASALGARIGDLSALAIAIAGLKTP